MLNGTGFVGALHLYPQILSLKKSLDMNCRARHLCIPRDFLDGFIEGIEYILFGLGTFPLC